MPRRFQTGAQKEQKVDAHKKKKSSDKGNSQDSTAEEEAYTSVQYRGIRRIPPQDSRGS